MKYPSTISHTADGSSSVSPIKIAMNQRRRMKITSFGTHSVPGNPRQTQKLIHGQRRSTLSTAMSDEDSGRLSKSTWAKIKRDDQKGSSSNHAPNVALSKWNGHHETKSRKPNRIT